MCDVSACLVDVDFLHENHAANSCEVLDKIVSLVVEEYGESSGAKYASTFVSRAL